MTTTKQYSIVARLVAPHGAGWSSVVLFFVVVRFKFLVAVPPSNRATLRAEKDSIRFEQHQASQPIHTVYICLLAACCLHHDDDRPTGAWM